MLTQRLLYVFYGEYQFRPVHYIHLAQLVAINYYIKYCKNRAVCVGEMNEFQDFLLQLCPKKRRTTPGALGTTTNPSYKLRSAAHRYGVASPDQQAMFQREKQRNIT
jgi:hypothetical protein